VVSLIFKTETSCLLKLTHIRMGKLNRLIPNPRVVLPFMAFEETPIEEELKQTLHAPVKFVYNKGLITDIVFDGVEKPWSANIKRGVLNMLQVNVRREGKLSSEEVLALNELRPVESEIPESGFFRVLEKTLEGECETLYTIVQEPSRRYSAGPVMNVTKTINFEKCSKRPSYKYNFRFQDACPTCDSKFTSDEKFLKSSSVMKYNITGTPESFMIEKAQTESQYVLVPFNEEGNVIVSYVNQTLKLVKTGPIETRVPELSSPVKSDSEMVYSLDFEIKKEAFYMEGEIPHVHYPTEKKVEMISTFLRKLIAEMRETVEDSAPRYFLRMVNTFRLMRQEGLERVWKMYCVDEPQEFTPEEHKKIKSLIVDAMATAGTKECVSFIVEKTKSRQISPVRAALAIKSLIQTPVVSKEMIEKLLTLTEEEICRRNPFLKQSVWLTVGTLMNALCSPNEDVLATEIKIENIERRFCPRELRTKYVELLITKFRESQKWEDKVLYLKTIANAGLDLSVFELEKIIRSTGPQREPTFIRFEAVKALRQLKDIMPRKIQRILMPIYMNRYEAPELRIVSVYQVLQTLPERSVLDQIARRLFSEPSRQVASFVYTYMKTVSNSSIPCEKRLAEDMKLALRHARHPHFSYKMGYSKLIHKSVYSHQYKLGMDFDWINVFSNTSYWPKYLGMNFNPVFGGFWAKNFLGLGMVSEGVENLFWKYFGERGFVFEKPIDEYLRRPQRSIQSRSPLNELKSMVDSLGIRPRSYFPERPKAYFFLKVKDQEFGFLPISFESLPEDLVQMVESGSFDIRSIKEILENGYRFNFYKGLYLHELSYKIPTTLGLPLKFHTSVPTVMSLTGEVKVIMPENKMSKIKLVLNEVKPSLVSQWISKVTVWNPVVSTGLKVKAKAKIFYPITCKVEVDLSKTPKEVTLVVEPPRRKVNALTLETRPITFTKLWSEFERTYEEPEKKTIMGEDWTRVKKINSEFGEKLLGVKMTLRGSWHRTPVEKLSDTPFCPLSGPNKLVFSTEPGYEMPKEYIVKLSSDLFKTPSEELKPEFREFEPLESEESPEPVEIRKMIREFIPRRPTEHQIRIEVTTRDSSTPRRFNVESWIRCGEQMKYCKLHTRLESSPLPELTEGEFKLCIDGETLVPETPQRFSELRGKKALGQLKVTWGRSCQNSEKFIRMNVIAERSQKQIEHERLSPEVRYFMEETEDRTIRSPVFQYEHLYEFSHLLKYKLDMEYSQVPVKVQNITNALYRLLKHKYYYQTDVAQIHVRNAPNKIRATLTIDPRSKKYVNVTIKTPSENATFKDIPVHRYPVSMSPVNVRHTRPLWSVMDEVRDMTPWSKKPVCHISSRYIKTFDEVKYSVPLTECWSTLVKDCGSEGEPNFGVFIKKIRPDSEQKKIKVVTPLNKIELIPESDSYESVKIEVNGEKFFPETFEPIVEHGHIIATVEKVGEYVKLSLPETGVKIFFDGYSANVKLSHMWRNIQCGLCGHYDHEHTDEFRLPNQELTEDVREFFTRYTHREESCRVPELPELCSTPECQPEPLRKVPVLCPVCKHLVRRVKEEPKVNKELIREMVERFCEELPSETRKCKRFFETKVEELVRKIKEDRPAREICASLEICLPEDEHVPMMERLSDLESQPFPILRTKVIEQENQLCFSKTPVPVCPHHTYTRTVKPTEKRVVYTCLPRDDSMAEIYFRRAMHKMEVLREVEDLPASFTQPEVVPEVCSRLH